MEAAVTGRPVLVPDLHHTTGMSRWPTFAAAVVEQSWVGALFAVPLQWGAINLGVLDLYRKAPGSLSGAQLRDAMRAADMAALTCAPSRPCGPRLASASTSTPSISSSMWAGWTFCSVRGLDLLTQTGRTATENDNGYAVTGVLPQIDRAWTLCWDGGRLPVRYHSSYHCNPGRRVRGAALRRQAVSTRGGDDQPDTRWVSPSPSGP